MFSIRKEKGLLDYSGLMCADIDAKDNPGITDFSKLRDQLTNIVNVAYSSLSASGKGVFCLIPIKYPEQHKQHFEALKRDFERLGIIIDKSCGDVSRLRIYSYDSEAYLNLDAVPYESIIGTSLQAPNHDAWSELQPNHYEENNSETRVDDVLSKIEANAIDITENYQQWFQVGCALANEFGEYGREMFHRASRYYTKYNANATNKMFSSCLAGGYSYSLGTFFYWAEQYGLK